LHDLDDIKNLFNTNLFGTIDLTQQSLPLLRESKGRIVMISSVAGKIGRANGAAYSGSKFAMEAMSDSLRREVSSMGISVSIIEPAFVRTPILDKAMDDVFENRSDRADDVKMLYSKYSTPEAKEKAMKVLAYADEPIVTSEAIRHALTSPNPSTRYAVANFAGIPAYLIVFVLPFIPDRVLDFFLS
jgi:NAD(P)-dependent dehydrogenase (short-subunit alcohol dehydrogenase family)